jgi:hypothetical protein
MATSSGTLVFSERTALINHLRALLLERGIVVPQGRRKLEEQLSTFADEDEIEALSPRIRALIEDLRAEWRSLDERIAAFDKSLSRWRARTRRRGAWRPFPALGRSMPRRWRLLSATPGPSGSAGTWRRGSG